MSFFDPQIINESLPQNWFDYEYHLEVDVRNVHHIQVLESKGWVKFAGGDLVVNSDQETPLVETVWLGLRIY